MADLDQFDAEFVSGRDIPTLDDIAKLIGEDKAVRLSADHGGRRVYIPANPQPDSRLVLSIGMEAAQLLAKRWGGERCVVASTSGRRARVALMHRQGLSVSEMATRERCSTRTIYYIIAELADGEGVDAWRDDRQMELFSPGS